MIQRDDLRYTLDIPDPTISPAERWRVTVSGNGSARVGVAPGAKFGIVVTTEIANALYKVYEKLDDAAKQTAETLYGPGVRKVQ